VKDIESNVPCELVTNHLDIDLFAHAKPQGADEVLVNPWLKFSHPTNVRLHPHRRRQKNLPESGLHVTARLFLTRHATTVWRGKLSSGVFAGRTRRWDTRGTRTGRIAVFGLLRRKAFIVLETHFEDVVNEMIMKG
jgi:hypothetical protein